MSESNPPGFYRTPVGDLTVVALWEGAVTRERPANYVKNVDPALLDAAFTSAGITQGDLKVSFTAFLVEAAETTTLIDAGFGENGHATTGKLVSNLAAAGHAPDAIDHVLVSHFHTDHIAGLITKDGNPVYPNATVHVPRPEWDFWMSDECMASANDSLKRTFVLSRKVFGAFGNGIQKFDWGEEVLPGITSVKATGHTPGMSAFDIVSGDDQLLFVADVTNNPAIFARYPDWQPSFDVNGEDAVATRHMILGKAADENLRLAYYHAPFPGLGRVYRSDGGYTYVPQIWGADW